MQKRVAQYPQGLKTANMSECCDLCKPGNTIGCTVWIFRKLDGSSGMCWPMAYVHGTRHVVGNVIGGAILPGVEQTYSCWLRGEVIIKQCMPSGTFSTYIKENNGTTWEEHKGTNCYVGHGASWAPTAIGKNYTIATCEAACEANPKCKAITVENSRVHPPSNNHRSPNFMKTPWTCLLYTSPSPRD